MPLSQVSITCTECSSSNSDISGDGDSSGDGDCYSHGKCNEDKKCDCDKDYFGFRCEFEKPCEQLATEKARKITSDGPVWRQDNPITLFKREENQMKQVAESGPQFHQVYNRPVSSS